MTDRDRLIELFEAVEKDPAITCPHYKTDKTCDTCKYTINNVMCNHTLRTVDYLLANGVIVPPCKVGDKVYYPSGSFDRIFEKTVDEILLNENESGKGYYIHFASTYMPFENIGKTVFLTKEEAEKALAERK